MNLILVHNPKSGSSRTVSELRTLFKKHSITIDKFIAIDQNLARSLAPHIKKKAVIAALGGDGTLSAVASQLVNTQATFVPLSGGTLNHFTKDLGIAQDIDEAISALSRSKVHRIDTASVNGEVFINNSSIGVYPTTLHARKHFEDKIGKWPAAIIANLRALLRLRIYTVTINNKTIKTPFIFIGNNTYDITGLGGPVRKRLDNGTLSVFVAKTASRGVLLKMACMALIGRAHELDEFDSYSTVALTIETRHRRISVSRDGEVSRLHSPLEYRAMPAVLRVRY